MKSNLQQALIDSKYHLSVVRRMFENYNEYQSKRFLVGIINELAKSSSNTIRAFLIIENVKPKSSEEAVKLFKEKVAPKYIDEEITINILKSLEIQKAQKTSPVQFSRNDKIILLINGKYRFLTIQRLKELIDSVEIAISKLSRIIRQI